MPPYSISAWMIGWTHVAFGFLTGTESGRVFDDQRIECFAHLPGTRLGVAAAGLAGIDEPIPVPAADVERSDLARPCAELFDKRHNGKRLALGAFELQPNVLAARAVGRIATLGDDPFKLELARVAIDGLAAVHFEVLDVDDLGRRLFQYVFQGALTLDQRRAAQVVSVEIEQVESEVDQAIGVPFRELAP
jgi:hypothetical protein